MRHAAKVDNNHAEIRDALRKIPGMAVLDTSAMSGLGCDLLCSWQAGPPVMLEVKSSRRAALTDSEKKLAGMFPGHWHRVDSVAAAVAVFGLSMERAPF